MVHTQSLDMTHPAHEGEADPYQVPSKLFVKANWYQKVAAALAILCAIIALAITISYCKNSNLDEGYLGGLNWNELIFNWHPILMVTGMILCSVTSQVTYRLFPFKKLYTKSLHAFLHFCAIICICVGFSAVYIGNNNKNKNNLHQYFPNFASIHSMLGLAAILIYAQNYILGFIHFFMPVVAAENRKAYMPIHMFLGMFSLFGACFAALTGIQQLSTENGCYYDLTSPDYNPASHYHLLKGGCKTLNGMGIMILATAFFAAWALWDVNTPIPRTESSERPLLQDRKDRSYA